MTALDEIAEQALIEMSRIEREITGMVTPRYEIWAADLNSLYDDEARPEVFMEDCVTYADAVKARAEYQTHDCAAMIRDKETGEWVK